MTRIVWDLPDDVLLTLKVSAEELGPILRMAASVKMVELGRISSGAAARLAGVPRVVFLSRLADYGVDSFSLTEKELRDEVRLFQ